MGSPLYYFETLITLVTMFTLLVAAHELGHYLFARLFNMGVEEFAIGFGKRPIFEWMRRSYEIPLREGEVAEIKHPNPVGLNLEGAGSRAAEDMIEVDTPGGKVLRETTRFTVRAWPLGGFVRIKGMMPEEDGSETKIAGGFYNKPPWQRLIVLFAGPMFSVLAGILILIPLFMMEGGKPNNRPELGTLASAGAAAKAGFKVGDRIESIDGKPIPTFFAVVQIVRTSPGKNLDFEILRGGNRLHLSVTPEMEEKPSPVLMPDLSFSPEVKKQAKLGASPTRDPIAFGKAFVLALSVPIEGAVNLVRIVKHPSTFKDNVGGPIAITKATYDTVQDGLLPIIYLAAMLSISIGIMNLLPVMPLDGGQMALAVAEMFRRGKRLSMQVQSMVLMFGFAFMCVLIVCVFFVDITRFVDNGKDSVNPPAVKKAK